MRNSYFSSLKVKIEFELAGKRDAYTFHLTTIVINGQKRGCSGFIESNETHKLAYITTEPFFEGGLYGDERKTLMYRTARNLRDYSGGNNNWGSCNDIVHCVESITQ